jgi:hypothetical protein
MQHAGPVSAFSSATIICLSICCAHARRADVLFAGSITDADSSTFATNPREIGIIRKLEYITQIVSMQDKSRSSGKFSLDEPEEPFSVRPSLTCHHGNQAEAQPEVDPIVRSIESNLQHTVEVFVYTPTSSSYTCYPPPKTRVIATQQTGE